MCREVFHNDVAGVVGRTIVTNHDLYIVIGLFEDAFYCFLNERFTVISRNVDGNLRNFIGSTRHIRTIFGRTFLNELPLSNFSTFRPVCFI